MKKKRSDSPKNTLKKQLISGGVYIALSAVAVAVTVNTVMNMMPDNNLPDLNESIGNDEFKLPVVPQYNMSDVPSLPQVAILPDASVSRSPSGVSADVEESESTDADFTAVPQIPQISYGTEEISEQSQTSQKDTEIQATTSDESFADRIYIKPCDGFITVEHSNDIPVYSPTFSDYRTHSGIDIAADKGSLVNAVANGVVTEIYTDALYGNTLKLETEDGCGFVYSNLSEDFPEGICEGVEISIGTVVGCVGESAISEASQESHLHFEMYVDGNSEDPRSVIDF